MQENKYDSWVTVVEIFILRQWILNVGPPPSYASIYMTVRPCKQTQSPGFAAEHMATVKGGGRDGGGAVGKLCVLTDNERSLDKKTWVIRCLLAKSHHVIMAHDRKQVPT